MFSSDGLSMFAFLLTRQEESCKKSRPQDSELLVFSMNEEVFIS